MKRKEIKKEKKEKKKIQKRKEISKKEIAKTKQSGNTRIEICNKMNIFTHCEWGYKGGEGRREGGWGGGEKEGGSGRRENNA